MNKSTNDILSMYMKQKESDDKNNNKYGDVNELNYTDSELEAYKNELDSIEVESNSLQDEYKRFHNEYKKISENELKNLSLIKSENVTTKVVRAYCPKCGKELISKSPTIFNPFTLEKISKHECDCGFKANLEHAYPRIAYFDEENNEVKAFAE